MPTFGPEMDGIDWNDIAKHEGLSGLRRELDKGLSAAHKAEQQRREEQHQQPETMAEQTEENIHATQELVSAFRDLRGTAGRVADQEMLNATKQSAAQKNVQSQGLSISRRAGR